MIKSLYRFIFIALALPLVMASCHDEVEAVVDDGMEFQMVLRIPSAEGEPGATRGMTKAGDWTPDNPYTDYTYNNAIAEGEHEGLDYYVIGKDLLILFCQNGKIVDYAEPKESRFITAQGGFYEFFVKGKLNIIKASDSTDKNYDIVVLANTKGMLQFKPIDFEKLVGSNESGVYPELIFDYVGRDNLTDIAHTFTENNFQAVVTDTDQLNHRDDVTSDNRAARIPMWGRVEGKPITEGTPVFVPIMRSLAKIRICLADHVQIMNGEDDMSANFTYTIDKIEMVGASTQGTLMPKDAHFKVTDDSPTNTNSKGLAVWWPDTRNEKDIQNIPEDAENNHLHLQFYHKPDTKYFYTYAPETAKGTGFHFNVFLTCYKKGTTEIVSQEEYQMEFGDYTPYTENSVNYTGRLLPVMRNHYYMYQITKIVQGHTIKVEPWVLEPREPIMM